MTNIINSAECNSSVLNKFVYIYSTFCCIENCKVAASLKFQPASWAQVCKQYGLKCSHVLWVYEFEFYMIAFRLFWFLSVTYTGWTNLTSFVPSNLHFTQLCFYPHAHAWHMMLKNTLLKVHCVCVRMKHFIADYFITENVEGEETHFEEEPSKNRSVSYSF